MKLFELIGVKKFHNLSLDELVQLYSKKFNKKIASSSSAIVFEYSPTEIVKFWINDPAYKSFLDLVIADNGNENLPKLKSKIKTITAFHKRISQYPEKINYVVIEKLIPVKDSLKIKTSTGTTSLKNLLQDITKVIESDNKFDYSIIDNQYHNFIKTLIEIGKKLKSMGYELDLYSENIMKRSNGTLVISDPIYDNNSVISNTDINIFNDPSNLDFANDAIKGPKMKITEILNTKHNINMDQEDDYFHSNTIINGNKFRFSAELLSKKDDIWEVVFGKIINNSKNEKEDFIFNLTKEGFEFKVFSFVKDSFNSFLDNYKPNIVKFSIKNEEESKGSLYERILKTFKRLDYTYSKTPLGTLHTEFILKKK